MTEKMLEDEELKGLEREIDAAVDRLFVEKGRRAEKAEEPAPPLSSVFQEKESKETWQMVPPVSVTPLPSKPFEKLETLLLSLEWEISKENLRNAMEEILKLRKEWERSPEISTLLLRMASVLKVMMQNEEQIGPHLIRFLLDTKETIKLLLRKEEGEDLAIYKKLAQAGIEARFACLEEVREARKLEKSEPPKESSLTRPELSEEVLKRIEILSERMDQLVKKLDHHLSLHEKVGVEIRTPSEDRVSSKKRVTVFKTGERLFGVESEKVFRLFKVPTSLQHKMSHLKKFQVKGLEVKIIPLGTFFSLPEMDRVGGEQQVLILKDDSEYKGILMNRVLSRLYGPLEPSGELNEYLLGMIRWTYEDLPIKVPILNLRKL